MPRGRETQAFSAGGAPDKGVHTWGRELDNRVKPLDKTRNGSKAPFSCARGRTDDSMEAGFRNMQPSDFVATFRRGKAC